MGKIKISYDKEGNTLNVWFDDPEKEFFCEETGEEVTNRSIETTAPGAVTGVLSAA